MRIYRLPEKGRTMLLWIMIFGFSFSASADTISSGDAKNASKPEANTIGSHQYGERRRVVKPAADPPQPVIVVPYENQTIKSNKPAEK